MIQNREDINKKIQRRHVLLFQDGSEQALDLQNKSSVHKILENVQDEELKAYIKSEELGGEPKAEPPSLQIMRQHELVDYEPASDSGNMRMYPKGQLVFSLLKKWADQIALDKLQCLEIASPIIYDWSDKEIRSQAASFHENHYVVKVPSDKSKEFVLRFAADFGLFKIMKEANFSYKMLPLRVYEFSKSFRYEKSGSVSGLKRLRAFHMPDIHCFCKDIDQSWEEYKELYKRYADLADGMNAKYAIVFRIVEDFYEKYKDEILEMLQYSKRPAFIEVLSEMKHYWAVKHEFQGIDSIQGNVQLSSVQLDVKDASLYGIEYVDKDGSKKGSVICHSSIERWMYVILEQALLLEKPCLPLWLAPSQVRIIPVSQKHLEYASQFEMEGVRFDIDDSEDSLGKKIAKANKEWVPYVAVIGDKEIESGKIMVSNRYSGSKKEMSFEELEKEIKDNCKGKPFERSSLPRKISMRPIFRG